MAETFTVLILVALVIIGPPALLIWLVRRRRRRERELREAVGATPLDPRPGSALSTADPSGPLETSTDIAPVQGGEIYRFPYGVPLVIYPLYAVGMAGVRAPWMVAAMGAVAAIVALLFLRLALSDTDFTSARTYDPSLNLPTWRINWLLFFALPPALLALFALALCLQP